MPTPRQYPDLGFLAIVMLIATVAAWLLAMPFAPRVARATMDRFHLRGENFLVWAIQQPIPAMYNFANQYRVYGERPGWWEEEPSILVEQTIPTLESGYVNHFPTRMITFANARYRLLGDRQERWYELHSTYRGQPVTTRIHLRPDDRGQLRMNRVAHSYAGLKVGSGTSP